MAASDFIAQTMENSERLLERLLVSSKKRQIAVRTGSDIGYSVVLSADFERFGGGSGPLIVGETATVVANEEDEKIRQVSENFHLNLL